MPRYAFLPAMSVALCIPLGACAAALVPAAISGLAARHELKASRASRSSPADMATTSQPSPNATAGPKIEAAPADTAAMRAGQVYAGALPGPPGATLSRTATISLPPPTVAALLREEAIAGDVNRPPGQAMEWGAALRHVAGRFGSQIGDSVLLVRGTTLDAPRWVPCGSKPQAVIVDLDAVVGRNGTIARKTADVLAAMQTIDVALLYTSVRADADLDRAAASIGSVNLRKPELGTTLFPAPPGKEAVARSTMGAAYCVIAIVGSRAEDFPNKATPETAQAQWNPGWFVVPALD